MFPTWVIITEVKYVMPICFTFVVKCKMVGIPLEICKINSEISTFFGAIQK